MSDRFRVVAIISAFNEADIIGPVLEHLCEQEIESYLIDDGSTDGTGEIARAFVGRGLRGMETSAATEPGTFDWAGILRRKEQLARELAADWYIHHDADEIRESPWPGTTLRAAIEIVDRLGYNAIDFRVLNFPPIDDGFRAGDDPRRYFVHYEEAAEHDRLQLKCWKSQTGGVVLAQGGHDVRFADRRIFPIQFPLRHYPLRGQTHARRKVFEERKPRFAAAERARRWHVQYDAFADESHRFLRDPDTLKAFDLDRVRLDLVLDSERVRELDRRAREALSRAEDAERVRGERDLLDRQYRELTERARAERDLFEHRHRELAVEHARQVEVTASRARELETSEGRCRRVEAELAAATARFDAESKAAAARFEAEAKATAARFEAEAKATTEKLESERELRARLEAELQDEQRERSRLEHRLLAVVDLLPSEPPSAETKPPGEAETAYGLDAAEDVDAYREWIARSTALVPGPAASGPRFGVILQISPETTVDAFESSMGSLRSQSYDGWELHVAGTPSETLRHALDERATGGSGADAWNAALRNVRADFVTTIDAGDRLAPDALARIAQAVAAEPEADVLFTDEDEIDGEGVRFAPHFKPGWSPDLLLSTPYLGRLLIVRRELLERVGGLGVNLAGSEEYDLALRATERARRVAHVAAVLYHRRGGSAGAQAAQESAAAALRNAIERRGEVAEVEPGLLDGSFRVRRRLQQKPLVSIVIPFRDGAALLERCVESIARTAGYEHFELLLVDNASWEPETHMTVRALIADRRARLLHDPREFNWSEINNGGAAAAAGELLLFLNSDIEGLRPGWLAAMVEHALRPEVGVVGARLLYPDGRVQHAGVIIGFGGRAEHAFRFCPGDASGYRGLAKLQRNCAAVTGACLMVRRSVFAELGGFDGSFEVAFNDVDFCMRARERGYLVVYTPYAELVHYESATRGVSTDDAESATLTARWGSVVEADPYFNRNLSRWRAEFALPRAWERGL